MEKICENFAEQGYNPFDLGDSNKELNQLDEIAKLIKLSIIQKYALELNIDISLKEYLQNETKNILSARHNCESKENINNNENIPIKKDDKKENKIQKIVDLIVKVKKKLREKVYLIIHSKLN